MFWSTGGKCSIFYEHKNNAGTALLHGTRKQFLDFHEGGHYEKTEKVNYERKVYLFLYMKGYI